MWNLHVQLDTHVGTYMYNTQCRYTFCVTMKYIQSHCTAIWIHCRCNWNQTMYTQSICVNKQNLKAVCNNYTRQTTKCEHGWRLKHSWKETMPTKGSPGQVDAGGKMVKYWDIGLPTSVGVLTRLNVEQLWWDRLISKLSNDFYTLLILSYHFHYYHRDIKDGTTIAEGKWIVLY